VLLAVVPECASLAAAQGREEGDEHTRRHQIEQGGLSGLNF
jgi:hypothetical protein